jgi:hypothetical protein
LIFKISGCDQARYDICRQYLFYFIFHFLFTDLLYFCYIDVVYTMSYGVQLEDG